MKTCIFWHVHQDLIGFSFWLSTCGVLCVKSDHDEALMFASQSIFYLSYPSIELGHPAAKWWSILLLFHSIIVFLLSRKRLMSLDMMDA